MVSALLRQLHHLLAASDYNCPHHNSQILCQSSLPHLDYAALIFELRHPNHFDLCSAAPLADSVSSVEVTNSKTMPNR
jgi:hypothetical protein